MINATNIRFAYGDTAAFVFPDLRCEGGDTLLICGESGTGKTTLLHLLAGLRKPHAGCVRVRETDLTQLKGRDLDQFRGRHIGIVFQQPHFVASLTVLENLQLAAWLAHKRKDKSKVLQLLERLGLAAQAHKKPVFLSAGQQQRAAIARALINDPAVLLADEPTSSLDDKNAELVAAMLGEQAREAEAALIIVTHDYRLKKLFHKRIELP